MGSRSPSSLAACTAALGVGVSAVVPAADRLIEVPEVLAGLLPDRGLRRGSTVTIDAAPTGAVSPASPVSPAGVVSGATSLALALLSTTCRSGSWCAAVGLPELGLVAAHQLGFRLDRLALVPRPGEQWAVVVAALLDGVEILLTRPPARVRAGDARRLVARVRERDAVLVVVGHDRWPEVADIRFTVVATAWDGLGQGYGSLRSREVEVAVTGRRAAAKERRCRLLLPGPDGTVAAGTVAAGTVAAGTAAAGTVAPVVTVADVALADVALADVALADVVVAMTG